MYPHRKTRLDVVVFIFRSLKKCAERWSCLGDGASSLKPRWTNCRRATKGRDGASTERGYGSWTRCTSAQRCRNITIYSPLLLLQVTEEVLSILRLLSPLTEPESGPPGPSQGEKKLDAALAQLQNVARKLAISHTTQVKAAPALR